MTSYADSNVDGYGRLQRGRALAAISNELVRVFAQRYGHGPTKARTLVVEDILICRMFDPFTTAEQTLLSNGRVDEVRRMRSTFHETMRAGLTAIVERNTGRRVIGFMADVEPNANLAALVFFLEPQRRDRRPMVRNELESADGV